MLVHNVTVRRLGTLPKIEEEARFGGLVLVVPRMSVAQLVLLVGSAASWRRQRRVARVDKGAVGLPLPLRVLRVALLVLSQRLLRLVQDFGKLASSSGVFWDFLAGTEGRARSSR